VKRRDFIALLASAAAQSSVLCPHAARAQKVERVRRIAVLVSGNNPEGQSRVAAFRRSLEGHGWKDDGNVRIDVHSWSPDPERIKRDLAELIARKPDVIVSGLSVAIAQAMRASRTIPIVFAGITDPVGQGFVASLAHPGGNATGFAAYEVSLGGKWVETLKEISPGLVRAAVLYQPGTSPYMPGIVSSIAAAGPSFGVEVEDTPVRNVGELENAIAAFGQRPGGGLIVPPAFFTSTNFELIVALAAKHRLPAIYAFRTIVAAGGLISYGIDATDQFAKAADYVDRIFRGAKPADLPVQQPTKFELFINLKTAKALGLSVPPTLLARADEVIE